MTKFVFCRHCNQTVMAFKQGKSVVLSMHKTGPFGNTCKGSNRKP